MSSHRESRRPYLFRSMLMAGAGTLAMGALSPVLAQSAQSGDQVVSQVEEIIVTAERREQRLQDVPIAITAVTAERLESAGIAGTEQLTQVTPGLNMTRLRQSSSPFIRGVGTLTSTAGFEAPTATYIDGVYMPSMPAGFFSFNNIARVEVLKGPQGTLFGRNALGGVIHVITKDPTFVPQAEVGFQYGNYDTVGGSFYGSTGLSETVAIDLSLNLNHQGEGFGRNIVTGSDVNYTREFNARTKMLVDLPNTRIVAALDYSEFDNANGLSAGIYPGSMTIAGNRRLPGWQDVRLSVDPTSEGRTYGALLNIRHDLGWADFVSISAARGMDTSFNLPGYTPTNVSDIHIDEDSRSFSQEFQLQSNNDGRLEWTLGLYAFAVEGRFKPLEVTGSSVAAIGWEKRFTTLNTTSYAAFGQATYQLTDRTRMTAGLRYTHDTQSVRARYERPNNPMAVVIPHKEETWGEPTWRLGVDHRLNDNVLLYASYNRGFKSGTYSASAPATNAVNPEYIDAFEIGQKADLFGRTLRINASAYYYAYDNLQLTSITGVPPLAQLLNAAEAEIYGMELEVDWLPTNNLLLRAALSLNEATYSSFPNGPMSTPRPTGGSTTAYVDLSGYDIVYTPDWTLNLAAEYTVPSASGDIVFAASAFFSDAYSFVPSGRLSHPSYSVVNGSITWTPGNGDVGLQLWARNLFDEQYWAYGQEVSAADTVTAAPPRTFGVAVKYAF